MAGIHMDCMRDDLCPCSCHRHSESLSVKPMHIIACCQVCNFCKRNIAMAFYPAHAEECGKKSLEYFKDIAKKY